ncbi:MAG: AAA family ATPase [Candidatus Heimdallarchaeaceae archaeon]
MIGRTKELQEIEDFIKKRRSFLIIGIRGIGKTTLLKHLAKKYNACYVEYGSLKQILETLIDYFNIDLERSPKSMTIQELLDVIRPLVRKNKTIILVDDADSLSKHAGKLLEKLEDENALIICASEKHVWNFRFRETLELGYLSRDESKELAEKYLGKKSSEIVLDLVATKSMGVPGKIKEICRDFLIADKNNDVNIFDKKSIFDFFFRGQAIYSGAREYPSCVGIVLHRLCIFDCQVLFFQLGRLERRVHGCCFWIH